LLKMLKLSLCLIIKHNAMKTSGGGGGGEGIAPPFLTAALDGDEWSASRPCRFTPGEKAPGTHWIGRWVGLRVGPDDVEKRKFLTLRGLELRLLGRPARSLSLYRLSYPSSSYFCSKM
jgi:hypothetical protein